MSALPTRPGEKAYYFIPSQGSMIISNSAVCTKCDDEVISTDKAEFTACKCSNLRVKGGLKEIMHTWIDPKFYKRKCIVVERAGMSPSEGKVDKFAKSLVQGGRDELK